MQSAQDKVAERNETSVAARYDMRGRAVLVVGAGMKGNIAHLSATLLASAGAAVAMADLPGSAVADLAEELDGETPCTAHTVDVADEASVDRLVGEVVARHGRIDGLLFAPAILETHSFLDLPSDSWDRTFAVNARGAYLVAQRVARQMVAQKSGGRIVLVASNVGRVPRLNNTAYGCSKAAVMHLARHAALELGSHGITVNAVCPGSTRTPMLVDVQAKGDERRLDGILKGSLEQWRTGIPMGRLAEPVDQAGVIAFLLSDMGGFVSGQAIAVDGAQTYYA